MRIIAITLLTLGMFIGLAQAHETCIDLVKGQLYACTVDIEGGPSFDGCLDFEGDPNAAGAIEGRILGTTFPAEATFVCKCPPNDPENQMLCGGQTGPGLSERLMLSAAVRGDEIEGAAVNLDDDNDGVSLTCVIDPGCGS